MVPQETIAGDADGTHVPATGTTTRIPVDLGELDRLRMERGWSKQDLAERLGITPKSVSVLYRDRWASPRLFQKLTELLSAPAPEVARRLLGHDEVLGAAS